MRCRDKDRLASGEEKLPGSGIKWVYSVAFSSYKWISARDQRSIHYGTIL